MPDDLTAFRTALDQLLANGRRLRDASHRDAERRYGPGEETVRSIQLDACVESLEDARHWAWKATPETVP